MCKKLLLIYVVILLLLTVFALLLDGRFYENTWKNMLILSVPIYGVSLVCWGVISMVRAAVANKEFADAILLIIGIAILVSFFGYLYVISPFTQTTDRLF